MNRCSICPNPHHAKGYCTKHYQRFQKHGDVKSRIVWKGGSHDHPLYDCYTNMLRRCANKENPYYGSRGIKVCDRWSGENGFVHFVADMGDRPPGAQIDRIDVNGDYEPTNCRWVNLYVQMGNTRRTNPVPGVGFHKQRNKWRARIKIKGKEKSLGLYATYEEAVAARQRALCS